MTSARSTLWVSPDSNMVTATVRADSPNNRLKAQNNNDISRPKVYSSQPQLHSLLWCMTLSFASFMALLILLRSSLPDCGVTNAVTIAPTKAPPRADSRHKVEFFITVNLRCYTPRQRQNPRQRCSAQQIFVSLCR